MVQVHGVEADGFADEVLELAGGDFAEALEARDFMIRDEFAAALPQQRHAVGREVRIA